MFHKIGVLSSLFDEYADELPSIASGDEIIVPPPPPPPRPSMPVFFENEEPDRPPVDDATRDLVPVLVTASPKKQVRKRVKKVLQSIVAEPLVQTRSAAKRALGPNVRTRSVKRASSALEPNYD